MRIYKIKKNGTIASNDQTISRLKDSIRMKQGWGIKIGTVLITFVGLISLLAPSVLAATVSQTFKTNGDVTAGQVVSLDKEANTVVLANQNNIANLYGVVVSASSVEFNASNEGALVANTGVLDTYVSTANGAVKAGDAIGISTIEGIGEKAIRTGKIIGVAQGSLDENTGNAKDFQLQEGQTSRTIKVGIVPVKVEVSNYNPATGLVNAESQDVSNRNKALQVADSIAGKPVNAIALVLSGIILLISIFVATFLLTSSGYASMIAMGRNPLSEKKIMQSLFRLIALSIGIFLVGLALSFVIIKIF